MKKITIDLAPVCDKEELHTLLFQCLDFPEWYGGNLDALYDCLTGVYEETEITIENLDLLEERMGQYALSFRKVMEKADEDNERITVRFGSVKKNS